MSVESSTTQRTFTLIALRNHRVMPTVEIGSPLGATGRGRPRTASRIHRMGMARV